MEVAHAPGIPLGLEFTSNDSAIETTDRMEIDMDMEIDIGPLDESDMLQAVHLEIPQSLSSCADS